MDNSFFHCLRAEEEAKGLEGNAEYGFRFRVKVNEEWQFLLFF